MEHHGASWSIMEHHGVSWIIMDHHGVSWSIMEHHGASWSIMEYHGASWSIMEHHGVLWIRRISISRGFSLLDNIGTRHIASWFMEMGRKNICLSKKFTFETSHDDPNKCHSLSLCNIGARCSGYAFDFI